VTAAITTALVKAIRAELERLARDEVRRALDERLPRWLTVPQAAERVGITESGIRERLRRGVLDGRKWNGRWYVSSSRLDESIERDGYDPRPTTDGAARLEPPAPGHRRD
jgi:hypothetical protein